MSRKASVFFILVLSFPIMRTFHNNLNWNDNINETLGEHINPEKPDVPLNKNDAFQKVQKRHVQEKR